MSTAGGIPGYQEGVPERFVPEEMHGQLVEAEHIARYRWSTRFCAGRRVLDAGCGVGYGAAMLRRAGAEHVTAVDISEAIVEVARQAAPEGVSCEAADIQQLPYADASFDFVVCFEAIEHVEDPDRALDELARVLSPGGLLAISSPNRARYVPGNPHHRHEYLPEELRSALARRFPAVRLAAQHVMVASVISASDGDGEAGPATVERMAAPAPEDETYILALAGGDPPAPGADAVTLTQFVELRQWLDLYERQDEIARAQAQALAEMHSIRQDRQEALTLLAERESRLAELEERLRAKLYDATQRADRLQRLVDDLTGSLSWRATAPVRRAVQAARARR